MPAPLRLGNYEPLLELAAGGMATVYVARQLAAAGFERLVVVKRVHRHLLGNQEFTDMFRDEAHVASTIRHPNVVAVDDVVLSDGELFLVMDYIEGCSLAVLADTAKKRGRRFEPPIVVRFLCDMLEGLHAAHEATDLRGRKLEVVHRDISPQNVLLGIDGACRIIDFGVAKARHRLTETRSGSMKGKISYMSPEQARSQPLDRRTDLFAAGIVAHELLTGKRLFKGQDDLDTLQNILEAPVPPASESNPAVSKELDAVLAKALTREQDARFSTAHEMLEAFERACTPATRRETAALLLELCSDRLEQRSKAIREMLEGDRPPLSVRVPAERAATSDATAPVEHTGTEAKLSVTEPTGLTPARSSPARIAVVVGVAVLAVVAFAVWRATLSTSKPDTPALATSAPTPLAERSPEPAAAPAASAAQSAARVDEREFTLVADRPIDSVRAPGLRKVEIDGSAARVVVATFTGTLKVDATLSGGQRASARVPADASSAKLSLVRETAQPKELQSNPYGKP